MNVVGGGGEGERGGIGRGQGIVVQEELLLVVTLRDQQIDRYVRTLPDRQVVGLKMVEVKQTDRCRANPQKISFRTCYGG